MKNLALLFLSLMLLLSCTKEREQKVDFEELPGFSLCFYINGFYVIKNQNEYNQFIEQARDSYWGCDTRVAPNEDFENTMLLITNTNEVTAASFKKIVKYDMENDVLRYKLTIKIPSNAYTDGANIMHVIRVPIFSEHTGVEFEIERK